MAVLYSLVPIHEVGMRLENVSCRSLRAGRNGCLCDQVDGVKIKLSHGVDFPLLCSRSCSSSNWGQGSFNESQSTTF